jgi:hypothetical protein
VLADLVEIGEGRAEFLCVCVCRCVFL